ncbi:MAG: MFS transporter [Burkholderiaceae bacterium]
MPPAPTAAQGREACVGPMQRHFSHAEIMAVLPGLVLAMFLAALDQTIVSIALYTIARDLHGEALMPWVVSGYLIVATVATPVYGKLSDLFGRWPVLSTAIGIYLAASLASTLAQSMPQLLVFRLLQGLGGGGLIVLVQTIVADIVERRNRGRYQAWLSGAFAVAAVTGPIVGGLLTQYVSWRAVFVLNLPLGLIAWVNLRRGLRDLPLGRPGKPIDYLGAVLLSVLLAAFMLALLLIGQGHRALDPWPLAGFATALGFALLLALWERRAPDPLLPPSLFRNRTVMISCAILGANFFVLYGTQILAPLALQTSGGLRASQVALAMLPLTLGVPVGSYFSGKAMLGAMRQRLLLAGGSLLSTLGAGILTLAVLEPGWPVATALLFTGFGIGMCIPATIVAVQWAVPAAQVGIATAVSGVFRTLGGALGIAMLSALLFATLTRNTAAPGALRDQDAALRLAEFAPALLEAGFHRAFALAAVLAMIATLLARWLDPTSAHAEGTTGGD